MALFFAPTANLVLSAVRRDEEGRASGANNTIREVGGVFGVAVLASVFSAFGGYALPQAFVDGLGACPVGRGGARCRRGAVALLIPARRSISVADSPVHDRAVGVQALARSGPGRPLIRRHRGARPRGLGFVPGPVFRLSGRC